MQSVVFGGEQHERVAIAVSGYERPASGEFYDDNWLRVEVSVRCGAFRGEFQAAFLTSELQSLRDDLKALHETLRGEVDFHTTEEQLAMSFTGDGLGHIQIRGEALDQAGVGNRLMFALQVDQSQLYSSYRSLCEITVAYPVRT